MVRRRKRSLQCLMIQRHARHYVCLKWGLPRYIVALAVDLWHGLDEWRLCWNAAAHTCLMPRVSITQEVHCLYIIDCNTSFSLSISQRRPSETLRLLKLQRARNDGNRQPH